MTKSEAIKRITKLKDEINFHRYNYHVLDKETMPESVLDALKNELFKLENDFPDLITPDSPSQRVSGEVSPKFEKSYHSLPMISLFDAFSEPDMSSWQERNVNYLKRKITDNYYCELKLDGLALSLRYLKGSLFLGATRGDGKVGENVTTNARAIESIPLQLRRPEVSELEALNLNALEIEEFYKIFDEGIIELRGEAVMSKKVFNDLNTLNQKQDKALLANTRNAVAGSIRQLDSRVSAKRKLDFYPYDIILFSAPSSTTLNLASSPTPSVLERGDIIKTREVADKLSSLLGFKKLKFNTLVPDLDSVFSFYQEVEKKRKSLPFEIDGVVVKFNNLKMWNELGIVGKAPRYMMAYKFSAEQVSTRVLDVTWQVGRTGTLTPIAILEPVKVGGAVVSRSTLHNFDEIERLDLMIGDTIILERSGDVIPKVISVLEKLRTGSEKRIQIPPICPICEGKIEKLAGEVAYRCLNKKCYAVNLRKISHFASKSALDLEGMGPKVIEQFLTAGLIKDSADLYSLKKEDLLILERFGEKKANNIITTLASKKNIPLAKFIYSLGIRHVGEETAELLSKEISRDVLSKKISVTKVINFFQTKDEDYFSQLEDIGPIVSTSIVSYWQDEHNIKILNKFVSAGVKLLKDNASGDETDRPLEGKIFVVTGSLDGLTRQEVKDKIKKAGGKISSDVSVKTDYLLLGAEPGSKYEKAKKLGIKIINESEFLKLF